MGTLAKASLQLTTDSTQLVNGLNQTQNRVKQWSDQTSKQINSTAKGLSFAGIKLPDFATVGKIGLAVGAIAGVVLAAQRLRSAFDEVANSILGAVKQARELGVSVGGLTALQYAAKISRVELTDLQQALVALRQNLLSADEPANRLFSQIGLKVQEIRQLPIDEATARIAEALQSIQDPSERARIALGTFGDKAIQLMPMLERGAAGIRQFVQEAKKFGISFDGTADVEKASEAIARMSASWEGFKNRAVINLAPYVEGFINSLDTAKDVLSQLADAFEPVMTALVNLNGLWVQYIQVPVLRVVAVVVDVVGQLADTIRIGFESMGEIIPPIWNSISDGVVNAIQSISDTVNSISEGVVNAIQSISDTVTSIFEPIASTINSALDIVTDGLTSLLESIGVPVEKIVNTITHAIDTLLDKAKKLAEWTGISAFVEKLGTPTKAGDAVRNLADLTETMGKKMSNLKVGNFFNEVQRQAQQTAQQVAQVNPIDVLKGKILQGINDLEKELRKGILTIGLTSGQQKLFDLEQMGASPAQLEKVKKLVEQAKNVDLAWGAVQMPPFETWQRQMQGLETMLESGRITWDQYAAGIQQAGENLSQAAGISGPIKTPQKLAQGSSDAVSTIITARLQDQVNNDPARELQRAMREAQEIRKKQLETAEKTLNFMQDRKFMFEEV